MLGQVVDRYRLVEKLGGGGMGTVFKGHHLTLDQYRAVKILPPHLTESPELVERFLREARRGAALCHPHLVRLEHVGQQDDFYYLVMDYVPGRSLRRLLDETGPLPVDRAVSLVTQICRALDYAHGQGVVHRDVKPANILVDEGDRAVLADFGVARWNAADGPDLTAVGETVGTPDYMSPEQIRGEPVDARSDLYSLGVVLYELLTGELPFAARSRTHVKRLHLERSPVPPRFYQPALPEAVERVVLRTLEKDPARRFGAASELEAALAAVLQPATPEVVVTPEPLEPAEEVDSHPTAVQSARLREWLEQKGAAATRVREPVETPPPSPAAAPKFNFRAAAATAIAALQRQRERWEPPVRAWLEPRVEWTRAQLRGPVREQLRQPKVAIAATAAVLALTLGMLLLLPRLGNASSGGRFTAERSVDPKSGAEWGVVRAHGVPVLVITQPSGGRKPAQRAEETVRQLERLLADRKAGLQEAELLDAIPAGDGTLVLARRPPLGKAPSPADVVVTVDAPTAATYAHTSRTSLALWWRDLLRDQIRLARGRAPMATLDTPYGRVLEQVFHRLPAQPRRREWIPASQIGQAVRELPAGERESLETAWRTVPSAWRGDETPASATNSELAPVACERVLASDSVPGFSPAALVDNDPKTAWSSRQGLRYQGERHWVKLMLPGTARVSHVELREGWPGPSQRQLRIKQARATFSDGSVQRLWRRKPTDPLRISTPPRTTRWVKLEVEQAFATRRPGASRLCLAEVRLLGPAVGN